MKRKVLIFITLLVVALVIFIYFFIVNRYSNEDAGKKRMFQKQIGTFNLNLNKTNLGNYIKDSDLYKNLTVTFKEDSTFVFNMDVPFIYDSSGKWEVGGEGPEEWNWLYYKKNSNIRTQFTDPWTPDSIFYLNSTTPKNGEEFIQEIYFKKLSK